MSLDETPRSPETGRNGTTKRARERAKEENRYTPVIVKRTDEARRHPDDILSHAIRAGLEQLNRPAKSLFLSSAVAGLVLAFTAMAVAVATQFVRDAGIDAYERMATAVVYPLGFVICIMSGVELFTEHTATAVYPVLDRKASTAQMIRLWILVILGNLVGAWIGAILLRLAEPVVEAAHGYAEVGAHLVDAQDTLSILVSAILAGMLMALGAWLILATPPTLSQMAAIYLVTFTIGLGRLHHSIAGAAEVFAALHTGDSVAPGEAARFLGLALLGNLIGGGVFVAGLNYSHIRKSQAV